MLRDEVVVRGRGEASALPDRAVVRAVVDGDGNGRDEAYAAAAKLAKQVDDVLTTYEAATDRATTAALVVHPKTRWRRGESVRTGWRASRITVVEITDLAKVGELLADLTAAGAALTGPTWVLDDDNPVHTEARHAAAKDARRRANAYANALGADIDRLLWIAEPGLRDTTPERGGVMAGAVRSRTPPDDSDIIEVQVEAVTVQAAVEVGFGITAANST